MDRGDMSGRCFQFLDWTRKQSLTLLSFIQIGDILQTLASTPSPNPQTISSVLASPSIIIKLVLLSFLSLAPILGREHLKAWLSPANLSVEGETEERISRWMWVKEWRAKVRLPSQSRTRDDPELELEAHLAEKIQIMQQATS
jgi:hypothetical protein